MMRWSLLQGFTNRFRVLMVGLFMVTLIGCQSAQQVKLDKLGTVDKTGSKHPTQKVFVAAKSKQEIRKAYTEYLNSASVNESARISALTRLAQLEYSDSNKLLKKTDELALDTADPEQERLYQQRLERTIQLLSTSIKDYPDARDNDKVLYQLAKAQAQNNQYETSIQTLNQLVEKYPGSQFYIESQFRIAEHAFSRQDYSSAEYAYSEVILSPGNDIFYEKSLFKRGWSRFKQKYYDEAVDDFLQAALNHNFAEFEKLNTSERDQFDEYFRAIGLAFTYLGGTQALHEYFKNRPDFKYTYHTYSMVSDLYLEQERYTDAAQTQQQFIHHFPDSENIPYAYLKIIEIWKNSGFKQKIYQAIEDFYVRYNPQSRYWKDQNENSGINRVIRRSLREYVILMSEYYHNRFQSSRLEAEFRQTEKWYQRYLSHYKAYAQQDKIYFNYAELLAQKNRLPAAYEYYELAAFDNDQLVNKEAAYALLIISNTLIQKNSQNPRDLVSKHLRYALQYVQQFNTETRTRQLAINATELAFKRNEYKTAIELADLVLQSPAAEKNIYVSSLKAASYLQLNEYTEAEELYIDLLKTKNLKPEQRREFSDKLALSIYKQGESANKSNDFAQAIRHYSRISDTVPRSSIAATGLYDAVSLNIQHKQWQDSITLIKKFKSLYPQHELSTDVSKKLSVAYLSSNQGIKAAKEFEKISSLARDDKLKAAALLQAAKLYTEKKQIQDAIRSYEDYVRQHKKPFSSYMEALNKLVELNVGKGSSKQRNRWLNQIVKDSDNALNNVKTDRTRYITSSAYLALARYEKNRFDRLKLSLPLKSSLRLKKSAMQRSVKLFGLASINKLFPITTEATYSIAMIYKDFSQALLNSDRPTHLNDEQLDQYEILLEDQAYPFEDKAIEFLEINLSRISEGFYNEWIDNSRAELVNLFPARYGRQQKVDEFIAGMQ